MEPDGRTRVVGVMALTKLELNMADDIRSDLEQQVSELRKEMEKISKSLSARVSDAVDQAGSVKEEAHQHAAGLVNRVRDQAHAVSDAAREHPGTALTLATSIGMMGLAVGVVIGALCARNLNGR